MTTISVYIYKKTKILIETVQPFRNLASGDAFSSRQKSINRLLFFHFVGGGGGEETKTSETYDYVLPPRKLSRENHAGEKLPK